MNSGRVSDDLIYHPNYTLGVRLVDISGSWSTYPWFESGLFVATSWDEGR